MKPYKKIMVYLTTLLAVATAFIVVLMAQSELGVGLKCTTISEQDLVPHAVIAAIASFFTSIPSLVLGFAGVGLAIAASIIVALQKDDDDKPIKGNIGKILLVASAGVSLLAIVMAFVLEGTFMYAFHAIYNEYYQGYIILATNFNQPVLTKLVLVSTINLVMDASLIFALLGEFKKKQHKQVEEVK